MGRAGPSGRVAAIIETVLDAPRSANQPPMEMLPLAARPFRHVPAARGAAWWGQGWRSFRHAPWAWVGMSVVLLLGSMVLHALPLGGVLAQWLMMPLFSLGALFAAVLHRRWMRARSITPQGLAVEADNEGALAESSRRWSARIGPLLLSSLLVLLLLGALLLVLGAGLATLFGVSLYRLHGMEQMMQASPGAVLAGIGMGAGLFLAAGLFVLLVLYLGSVAFWFVGTLVAIGGVGPWTAVRLSARAGWANLGALTVFTVLLVLFSLLLPLTLGLGLLVLLPVLSAASYASYDEVFGDLPVSTPPDA